MLYDLVIWAFWGVITGAVIGFIGAVLYLVGYGIYMQIKKAQGK